MNVEIHFEISSNCELKCIHCSSEPDKKEKSSLIKGKINDFLNLFDAKYNLYVCLSGGEPLMGNEFFPLLNILKSQHNVKEIGFFSSGCILNNNEIICIESDKAEKLRKEGIDFCYISLYSHNCYIHNNITRLSQSFHLTLETIRNLQKNGIDTRIHFVPMKYNYGQIEKIVQLLNDLQVSEIRFLRLVKHGRADGNWDKIGLNIHEQREMLQTLLDCTKNTNLKVTASGFPDIVDCRPFNQGSKCQAGISLYYVDWNGDVFPCACKKRSIENSLLNIKLSELDYKINCNEGTFRESCLQDMEQEI